MPTGVNNETFFTISYKPLKAKRFIARNSTHTWFNHDLQCNKNQL